VDARIPLLQQEEIRLRRRGDYDGALRVLEKMLEIDSSFSPALNNKAAILMMRGAYREALPVLEKAAEADPTNGQAFNNLGLALQKTGDSQRAVQYLERALELGYTHEGVRYNLGLAYFCQGMIDKALVEWQKVLRANPLNMMVLRDMYKLAQAAGVRVAGQTDIDETIIPEIREKLMGCQLTVFPPPDGGETLFVLSRK
jgi:tetratricopeptide (TPR) repeat protein